MPPGELLKGQRKRLWKKMIKFLQDKCGQEQLIPHQKYAQVEGRP